MAPSNWLKWVDTTKRQIRQLGRTIDARLTGLANGRIGGSNESSLLRRRIPIPIRVPVRNSMGTGLFNRYLFQKNQFIRALGTQLRVPISIRLFSYDTFRNGDNGFAKNNVPRGLYQNWNMVTPTRLLEWKLLYSTASIRYTKEAIKMLKASLSWAPNSLKKSIEDYKTFKMMDTGRGSFLEFKLPKINQIESVTFLNENVVDQWQEILSGNMKQLKEIQDSINQVFQQYGSLPVSTSADGNIQIHFPNTNAFETEALVADIGVTNGIVYSQEPNQSNEETDILSNWNSWEDLSGTRTFSPVLSEV